MTKIFLRGAYTVLGKIRASMERASFHIPVSDPKTVQVELIPATNSLIASMEVNASEALVRALEDGQDEELPEDVELEMSVLTKDVSEAARNIVSLVKYRLNQYEIDEQLISSQGATWSKDGEKATRPYLDTLPYVGFIPTIPQRLAGWRIEPPVSEPNAARAIPEATAVAEPPLDPPGILSVSQGFFVIL